MPKKRNDLREREIAKILLCKDPSAYTLHFIGIGGVSMYTLAALLHSRGYCVRGSDREQSVRSRKLVNMGIQVYIGHERSHVDGADMVIYTHAISDKNPELLGARLLDLLTLSRAELLGYIMRGYQSRIGVSGTHGKSTTVAMLDCIFTEALRDPTTLSGADLSFGEPMRLGGDNTLIYEACEYKDSFLSFTPTVAVALNLELDHTDYFPDIFALRHSFTKALSHASGFALVNMDDENLNGMLSDIKAPVITFGQCERANYRYLVTAFGDDFTELNVYSHGVTAGTFRINAPGAHNVTDAAAAIAVALECGVEKAAIYNSLRAFRSIPRRMELVGSRRGRPVYYDYAHHPTEIHATLSTLRLILEMPITVVFKPHTYSRTASLWDGFTSALSLADHVVLTDIYPAREEPIAGITSRRLSECIGSKAMFSSEGDVSSYVDNFTSGAVVVMGAGDLEDIKNDLISVP